MRVPSLLMQADANSSECTFHPKKVTQLIKQADTWNVPESLARAQFRPRLSSSKRGHEKCQKYNPVKDATADILVNRAEFFTSRTLRVAVISGNMMPIHRFTTEANRKLEKNYKI